MGKKINTILNLQDKFTPKLTEAGKKALIFKERVKNVDSSVQKIDSSLSKMAKTAAAVSAAGVAAMGAFAASCVKTYGEFQQSMSNVAGIMGIDKTSESYKKIEQAAREAGKSTTKTAKESADAISYMALAGWTEEQALSGLMPVLRASEATGADLATTSDLVTDSMSALGLKTNELQHYLDVCAKAQNKSNTSLTQMQEAYIGCGGTFKMFNTELDESGALLGVLANRGIKGSEAGNALQSTLINLTKKSGESAKAMEEIGVSAYDSKGNFKGITAVLKEVQKATAGMSEEQRNTYLTMIGGKNQLTTLNALMSGLTTVTSNGKIEFEELREELLNCNGSLDKMANTMTDNYAGALARAGSAVDDLKITVGQKFEPYITKFLNWFSEKLPGVTQKVSDWLGRNIPKAIKFCKSAFDIIKPAISFVINNFKILASVAAGVVVGLKAFSVITKVVSLYKKLKAAGSALKVVQLALNASMLACPLTWVAVGIGAVAGGFLLYKDAVRKAKEEDLEEHFGNIELSAEECGEAIQGIFGQNVYTEIDTAKSAYEAARESVEKLSEASKELNKLNFKLSLDPKSVPKEEYLKIASEYIENMNKALKDQQYALDVGIKLMISDTELAASFGEDAAKFYGLLSKECQDLGTKLKQAIENAYEHNWDFDSTEAVTAILKQQAEIQEKIAAAQSEARLEALKYDFANGDLSVDSYKSLMEAGKEEIGKLKEAYNQTRIDTIAGAKLTYGEDFIKLAEITEEANKAYAQKVSELEAKDVSLGGASIVSAYKEEFALAAEQFKALENSTLNQKDVYGFMDKFNSGNMSAEQFEEHLGNIANAAVEAKSISGISRENIAELYEVMRAEVEAMREDVKNLETIPLELQNALLQADLIGAIGGDKDSKLHLGTMLVAKSLSPEKAKELFEASEKFGENCPKGIFSDKNIQNGLTAADNLRNFIFERLSNPYMINADVKFNFNTDSNIIGPKLPKKVLFPLFSETGADDKSSEKPNKSNATGTSYFGGGLTEINEHGYEVIDLPAGSRIYPHNKSEKMMNQKQAINVSVIVQGNIFGIDDAIEIIGSKVCDRIVETVNCMA
ncbi:MAG: phage tail tape measure protein [Clostridiales bacterium]|nr:phage tail tape measure protein [Clostridiales bacterium]